MLFIAVLISFSFFGLAGRGGKFFIEKIDILIGIAIFFVPLIFILGSLMFFKSKYKRFLAPAVVTISLLFIGITGLLGSFSPDKKLGGVTGYLLSWPILKVFDLWITLIVFIVIIFIGGIIFWQSMSSEKKQKDEKKEIKEAGKIETDNNEKPSQIKKIFTAPKFLVKGIQSVSTKSSSLLWGKEEKNVTEEITEGAMMADPVSANTQFKTDSIVTANLQEFSRGGDFKFPHLKLLDDDKGVPDIGDVKINSAIVKRTFQNFDIQVEMSGVNIGPTVTQYTLKPAEGIKLSKITSLSNDLAMALAVHPIRIEAPIPGKSLVGIEIPNKGRMHVKLRNLLEHPLFQNSHSSLTLALGRDVAANPVFADLARMPHLLVAGSTGTGKTICLNNLIMSLLFQNSPETLKLILVDPKRVEFSIYKGLPHLLVPPVLETDKTVNILKWLVEEMEKRFDVLSEVKTRDIVAYNVLMAEQKEQIMPYIVLVIDELADLMSSKGRDVEASIVRLAQMARAVGIHLIVATQRPSVEVITGLIKANITSRIAFQVASQIDSRTILDAAGAEKLLGLGDMLFISAEISKPKRIQGAFISDKEVKRVMQFIRSKNKESESESDKKDKLQESVQESIERKNGSEFFSGEEDSMYEEAKKVVIQSRKASASLLQRRLRVGYARAARLLDILEERGVVGPGDGAKPREVYVSEERDQID